METLKVISSQKLAFESPRAVRAAAKIAGVDTAGKSWEQIKQAVIDAAAQIKFPTSAYREVLFPSRNFFKTSREVLFPTPSRPLAAAVVKIAIRSLKQE